jgi:hypothetical protein
MMPIEARVASVTVAIEISIVTVSVIPKIVAQMRQDGRSVAGSGESEIRRMGIRDAASGVSAV